MKKLISVTEVEGEGLEALLGEKVLLMCANYFYAGKLTGVNKEYVQLEDAGIVSAYSDFEKLHTKIWYVKTAAIESFGLSK